MKPEPKSVGYCINYMSDKPYFNNFINNILNTEISSTLQSNSTPVMFFWWYKTPEKSNYWDKIDDTLRDEGIITNSSFKDLQNYIFTKYPIDKYPEFYI